MTLSDIRIDALESPIRALEDQPVMTASELKAYFDGNAEQLMRSHNNMIDALNDPSAAGLIGFSPSDLIPAHNVQDAVEHVRGQITEMASGSIPDGSISAAKLTPALNDTLDDYDLRIADLESKTNGLPGRVSSAEESISRLQTYNEHAPFCAQFPLMTLCLTDGAVPEDNLDALATAALGIGYEDQTWQLGEQLALLCAAFGYALPSDTFRSRNTFTELLNSSVALAEIAQRTPVLKLIRMSSAANNFYTAALGS
ncbi:MAG: hypothetical protein ACI4PQ_05615 [Butyricicoccaceae bacterium]